MTIATKLAEQGLIERAPEPVDRRCNLVPITAAGRRRAALCSTGWWALRKISRSGRYRPPNGPQLVELPHVATGTPVEA
jgi:hypothetical protein